MRLSHTKLLLALAAACGMSAALAATWETVASVKGERIDLDKSRIVRQTDNRTTAWSRAALERDFIDEYGLRYTAIEALNRYDCEKHSFATVKRVYRRDAEMVREETVASPREIAAEAGSVDEKLLVEACRLRTVGEGKRVAEAASQQAAAALAAKPTVMYADMRSAAVDAKPQLKRVADKPADAKVPAAKAADKVAENPAEAKSGERPRYIELPKIDKSKLDEPAANAPGKAAEAKPESKPATKPAETRPAVMPTTAKPERAYERVVEVPAVGRHELERQYASSGPRRAPKKVAETAVAEHHNIHWSYEGEGGPANWAKLRADYVTCAAGRRQSPIDIREAIKVDLEPIQFDYKPSRFNVVDNGHTVQVNVAEGNSIRIMERQYQLVQFHFHRPSEERIGGRAFDMVIHLVHKDDDGKLAVIAVLLEKGAEHPLIQTIWNNMPLEPGQDVMPSLVIDPNQLLPAPERRAYYTYMGSLTTPPCTEDVLWMVFKQPVQVSPQQVSIFSRLYSNNARPVQATNGRLLKENR